MSHLTRTAIVASVLIGFSCFGSAAAQDVAPWQEKILADNCPFGKQIVALENTANAHIAKQGSLDTISPFLVKAAALSRKCSTGTKSPYARAWYDFSWANDSFRSVTSQSDADSKWPPALKVLRLLSNSSYNDVRSAAKQSYDMARAAADKNNIR